jgi:hypothetical protein
MAKLPKWPLVVTYNQAPRDSKASSGQWLLPYEMLVQKVIKNLVMSTWVKM